jgi:hypothetical protein
MMGNPEGPISVFNLKKKSPSNVKNGWGVSSPTLSGRISLIFQGNQVSKR